MALVHKHLIIRAECLDLPGPDDSEYVSREWLPRLIDRIGMKVLMGPFAIYCPVEGNRGMTAVAIIETSHIALHTWDEDQVGLLQLDVYTCGPLDPYDVVTSIAEFDPQKVEIKYLDREHNLVELPLPTAEEMEEILKDSE
jgi:S-adenosylmethionine/arginine decarboxylase-like enzyme